MTRKQKCRIKECKEKSETLRGYCEKHLIEIERIEEKNRLEHERIHLENE